MDPIRALVERIRPLASRSSAVPVAEDLDVLRPEDLADALQRLTPEEGLAFLEKLDDLQAANVLVELPTETARRLMSGLPDTVLALYLDILPMDDAIDLQEELDEERFNALLQIIPDEDAAEIQRLMHYPRGSVGRLMTERFFEVSPDSTMRDVLADLRLAPEEKYETVNDLYVLDENQALLGVFSLRKALRAGPDILARDLMNVDPITAKVTETDEEAARKMARYGFYALPVVDDEGRMLGVFTGDDAQAIIREADTEDVLALGAVSGDAEAYLSLTIGQLIRRRLPWLAILFVAETLTGSVLRHYGQAQQSLNIASIMFFLPLIIGAGGNSGSQVTTTLTRALAIGEVTPGDWLTILLREWLVALFIGLSLGALGFLRAYFGWHSGTDLSLVVGLALPSVVIWAATVGSVLPLAAKRFGLDPAVMSAPFITTFVDATGLIIYFEIALRLLPR